MKMSKKKLLYNHCINCRHIKTMDGPFPLNEPRCLRFKAHCYVYGTLYPQKCRDIRKDYKCGGYDPWTKQELREIAKRKQEEYSNAIRG